MKAEDLKNLNIAVIGAGYGGAAAAKALSLLGATVNVYEQASQMREVGAGIGLRPATMARFRQWGIFDAIAAVSSPSDYFEILSATGHPIMKDTWPEHGDQKQTHLIHRGDFIDALLGVLPEGMVHLGHKLEGIEDKGDRSVLTFTNGKTIEADLVVGADGIKSVVREQLFSKAGPVFSGEHAYRAVISADDAHGMVVDDNLRMYIGKGTKVYLLPLRHRNQMSFDITALNPDGTWAPTITTENLVATVEGFDERIVSIARGLDMDTVNIRAVYDIDPVDTWHTDSVVLMGDAAHSMLHHQGQGANSAIEDAGALADALAGAGSVREALEQFQATRKPVTDELQRISRQGWSEEEVNDVFPGQKPASQKPASQEPAETVKA
ncbi:monooxygenase FAD-binding [Pseudarthrobacter chlorophenolicus A6]|uniref:Monooxygenase FAD-binding n=1 Tax=Pseudarthrobacter chlorophenolicus (strain ATCC 700700 / DSM 12829 / CIP 107037 / JCM 12360 / KCTC 9906 / NCIMB 13794 / A6) TaxID=452863 RepID=B8HC56_PSECP|nr:FAD-dependent monooxygenase [Pseudarthrobacter chlorophenolicus]ACL38766.1 monooxygenase FAD-binding [Pseudarthrobacter chlorophenolicus A6]SDR09033.1 salicylate hydroxylase [Pseudarthrobacter chlorophenolicus]